MRGIQIAATVASGTLVADKHIIASLVRGLKDGPYTITIQPLTRKRSNDANRRYWALLTVAARELGYDDPEELHEGLALKFLALPPKALAGLLPRRRSTKSLNTEEFTAYMDAVERFLIMDLHLDLSDWALEMARA